MCGRYNIIPDAQLWLDAFEFVFGLDILEGLQACYNVAPSQVVPAIRLQDQGRALCLLRWGLVPSWAKEDFGYKCINARAETVADKPAFRSAFRSRRCLIPANGFYEWQVTAAGKQPYNIRLPGGGPFAMAGLWERWEHDGQVIESCSIIVTEANEQMSPIHNRMPVILAPDNYGLWLDPSVKNRDSLQSLLRSYSGSLEIYPVSQRVNSSRCDDPGCIESTSESG